MPESKKIVWLAHEGLLSGANLCLLEYADILTRQGYSIHIITPRLGELSEAARLIGIPSHEVYFYRWTVNGHEKRSATSFLRKKIRNRMAIKKINGLLQAIRPDFVATNTITMNVGAISAKQSNIKHIWFIHEFGEEDHGFSIAGGIGPAKKKMDALSYKVAVNSRAVYKAYANAISAGKLHIVHYAIPVHAAGNGDSSDDKKSGLRLIMLGQVAFSKNHTEAIEAVTLCRKKGLAVTLEIYGTIVQHDYADHLNKLIGLNQMQHYISIHDPVRDIGSLIPRFDALLICSRAEAFGRVTIEALKCGVPVIGADSGATPELVQNGVNGYLYQAGSASELALAIEKMVNNRQNFNGISIAEAAEALYNEHNTFLELKEVFN